MEIAVAEGEWGLYGPEAIGGHQTVWMSRGDEAVKLPKGFSLVARSLQGSVAAIENHSGMIYGLQYHPEVTHSTQGMETLWHFLLDVCGITADWKMQGVLEEEIKVIKGMVGPDEHVICALSGGVDSTDAATHVHKVDEIFIQSIKDAGLYDSIWQAFAVFLPVQSVVFRETKEHILMWLFLEQLLVKME